MREASREASGTHGNNKEDKISPNGVESDLHYTLHVAPLELNLIFNNYLYKHISPTGFRNDITSFQKIRRIVMFIDILRKMIFSSVGTA